MDRPMNAKVWHSGIFLGYFARTLIGYFGSALQGVAARKYFMVCYPLIHLTFAAITEHGPITCSSRYPNSCPRRRRPCCLPNMGPPMDEALGTLILRSYEWEGRWRYNGGGQGCES